MYKFNMTKIIKFDEKIRFSCKIDFTWNLHDVNSM